ncbi:Mitochondrial outer membrane protein porin of 34 kDa [Capsicum annuum]|nr:Mitochondrial outer membrane protein porin of 34 kDa [Capsicum annuum]
MGKGPGLYRDIGKKARDLLYKVYQTDEKISITSGSIAGVTISSSESKKDELFPADVKAQLKSKNSTTYIKVEHQLLHDYVGISTNIGLTENPIVNFSGVVGTNVLSLGTDVSFDPTLGTSTMLA